MIKIYIYERDKDYISFFKKYIYLSDYQVNLIEISDLSELKNEELNIFLIGEEYLGNNNIVNMEELYNKKIYILSDTENSETKIFKYSKFKDILDKILDIKINNSTINLFISYNIKNLIKIKNKIFSDMNKDVKMINFSLLNDDKNNISDIFYYLNKDENKAKEYLETDVYFSGFINYKDMINLTNDDLIKLVRILSSNKSEKYIFFNDFSENIKYFLTICNKIYILSDDDITKNIAEKFEVNLKEKVIFV